MTYINRRRFLKSTGALGFAAGSGMLAGLASQSASAADFSGYKALVCVFLKGGLDHADMVLPYDTASHSALQGIRTNLFNSYGVGSGNSSRDIANMLELEAENIDNFGGRKFAFSPEFYGMHDLFQSGDAAIVGNVGPLIEPVTRTSMDNFTANIPDRLFSHNDQQSTWMSLGTEGAQLGWGGQFLDVMLNADVTSNPIFSAMSTSGNDVFLSGERARQFSAPTGNPESYKVLTQRWRRGNARNSEALVNALRDHLSSSGITDSNLYMKDVIGMNMRAVENNETYINAIENSMGVSATFPDNGLGNQLKTVANTIAVRDTLNVRRQIFYVAIGGFDTHDTQRTRVPALLSQIGGSISAFKTAMTELGVWDDITLFTASDFGRTLIDNGDGTDHGWGAHHLVVGGSVNGKRIYGDLPEADLSAESYTASRGRLIPTTSVDQYAASLGSWFGLSLSEMSTALPNLQNFSVKDIGLFGTSA